MKKILVIGIGSRIMMDDAIGIFLVEDMMQLDINPDIAYIVGETDVDYCIEEVLNFDNVIVIDAYLSGKQPGETTTILLDEFDNEKESCLYSIHGVHLLSQLQSKKHYQAVYLIGIEPYEINYGFTLSAPLQERYSQILSEVSEQISKCANKFGGRKNA